MRQIFDSLSSFGCSFVFKSSGWSFILPLLNEPYDLVPNLYFNLIFNNIKKILNNS